VTQADGVFPVIARRRSAPTSGSDAMSHRLRSTVVLLVILFVGFAWLAVAMVPARASTMHTLTIRFWTGGVVLTVPSSWHVSAHAPTEQCGCGGDFDPICIVSSGDYHLNPNNCELVVGGNVDHQRPDDPVPGYRLPKCDSWTTSYEAHSQFGSYPGEYRIFLDRCHDLKSEQWTSLTTPSISIWHPMQWNYNDTLAAHAVGGARIVAKGLKKGRVVDLGYVRDVFLRNGHAYVRIDRAVMSLNGHAMNHNPATYMHRIRRVKGAGRCPHFISNCGAAELRAQFRKGPHPADGTRPLANRLIQMSYYAGWSLDDASRYAFESMGDPGHCGCR
jgi:hypothetical protein